MIDYMKLANSINFYKQRGFKQIEVPWVVKAKTSMITAPSVDCLINIDPRQGGTLVGSAEQSFLQMVISKQITPGQYVACTPCFRNEENIDELHWDHFMKVELFKNDAVNESELKILTNTALLFFNTYTDSEIVKTDIGYDIVAKGIELGSYGIREHELTGPWIYGTGCAEPRLSTVKKRN